MIHQVDLPHVCPHCSKHYFELSELEEHVYVHIGAKEAKLGFNEGPVELQVDQANESQESNEPIPISSLIPQMCLKFDLPFPFGARLCLYLECVCGKKKRISA